MRTHCKNQLEKGERERRRMNGRTDGRSRDFADFLSASAASSAPNRVDITQSLIGINSRERGSERVVSFHLSRRN